MDSFLALNYYPTNSRILKMTVHVTRRKARKSFSSSNPKEHHRAKAFT